MKQLKDMTDRDLIIFNIGETRGIKKLLTNHLSHHEKQDDRRWQVYKILLAAVLTVIGGFALIWWVG
ncbi:hypothetical protein LCGC14_0356280 [marine sediment metagenome]|uniref:Uncharacterized protein n=1 Tax=marine sediment metagenome TaxID=412755 RepID=A0A0F9VWQ7_9ZZZZ